MVKIVTDKYSVEKIDTKEFETAISAMDSAVSLFKNARGKIIKITDPVVDSWEGDGASAFEKVYKKLKTELEDEETNLATVRDDLKSIKESYEGWDKDLKTHFQNNGR